MPVASGNLGPGVSSVRRRLLCQLLDGRQARSPASCGLREGAACLFEAFLANGVANLATAPPGRDETAALEDGEVLGNALPRDRQRRGERARRSLAALEQEIEQANPHRVAERGPEAVDVLAPRGHRSRFATTRTA